MTEITPIPLADLTTLRVGGTPLRMVEARARDEPVVSSTTVHELVGAISIKSIVTGAAVQ